MRIRAAVVWGLLAGAMGSFAQTPVLIQSRDNGSLSWTNDASNATYRVEWAATLDGPWFYSWDSLNHIAAGTNKSLTVSIPMFYRVTTLPASEHLVITADPSTVLANNGDLTVLTVSGGTPPYSWTVSDGTKGTVSPAAGYSTLYTRVDVGDNAAIATDSLGDYAIIVIQQP